MTLKQLTLEQIRAILKDRSVHTIARKSGLSTTVLYKILANSDCDFRCSTLSRASEYLLNEYPEAKWYLENREQGR